MTAASVLVLLMARDGFLDRGEGVVLFLASIGYTLVILRTSRMESARLRAQFSTEYAAHEPADNASRPVLDLVCLLGGIGVIFVGADLLVSGAVTVHARSESAMPLSASPSSRSARPHQNS